MPPLMTARRIDGSQLAAEAKANLRQEIEQLRSEGVHPHLVALSVGHDESSEAYLRRQQRGAEGVGIDYSQVRLPQEVDEKGLLGEIDRLNRDPSVTGVILQRPLPTSMDDRRVQCALSIDKDVEGLTPANLGLLYFGRHIVAPATALGVIQLLQRSGIELKGREVTVIGASDIVGKPLSILLTAAWATVTLCHIETRDLAAHARRAEILISAVGKPGLVTADMVRPGATVIDVGYSRRPCPVGSGQTQVSGDVDFDAVSEIAGAITPVPGGVGPMTVVMLLANTVRCAVRMAKAN